MALDDFSEDYLTPEVGIAVAALAAVLSPQVRGVLRRGAVYGLAGVLKAGGVIGALGHRGAADGQHAPSATFVHDLAAEARQQRDARARAMIKPSASAAPSADASRLPAEP